MEEIVFASIRFARSCVGSLSYDSERSHDCVVEYKSKERNFRSMCYEMCFDLPVSYHFGDRSTQIKPKGLLIFLLSSNAIIINGYIDFYYDPISWSIGQGVLFWWMAFSDIWI